jgi:5-methylcytosine-specific restriction endonuclease McrA
MNLDLNASRIEVWADWYDPNKPPTTSSIYNAIEQVEKYGATIISPRRICIHHKLEKSTQSKLNTSKKFKQKILVRDNYTCFYCGEYGNTVDHLLPKSKGGKNTNENCVCACEDCNFRKDNMTMEEFLNKN